MKRHRSRPLALALTGLFALGLAPAASAQANVIPGLDLRLSAMRNLQVLGREGAYPDGMNGVGIETTVCNEGSVEIEWRQPMNLHHPKIAFLVAVLRDDRMVQLSNRSYVKHGFFALNGRSCGPCQAPAGGFGEFLGIDCSDTYTVDNNGDNYYLGPPDEIDPWLGSWARNCSLFDRGYPDVGLPASCNGLRSLSRQGAGALGPVNSRVQLSDADLLAGGEYFFQGHYVVEGLAEAGRENSLGSRAFTPSWTGLRWELTPAGPLEAGSVLRRWPGARVDSATNGLEDGRVYVAVKVTGPVVGFYRYEYALHNRDNAGGIAALRIPLCRSARLRAVGCRDVDRDPASDWIHGVRGDELVFLSRGEPLAWNTIHNFWFESDAAPLEAGLVLAQFKHDAARPEFAVTSLAPLSLAAVHLGPGCALDTPPTLYPVGSPARARLGNASFGLASSGNVPGEPSVLLVGLQPGQRDLSGCPLWISGGGVVPLSTVASDLDGVAHHPLPVPPSLALEGKAFRLQAVGRDPGNGPVLADFELSDALMVRLGNAVPDCD